MEYSTLCYMVVFLFVFMFHQVPIFLTKAIELYEMICVRHGLMVVGPTGGGKSKNIAVLKEALTHLKVSSVVDNSLDVRKPLPLSTMGVQLGCLRFVYRGYLLPL